MTASVYDHLGHEGLLWLLPLLLQHLHLWQNTVSGGLKLPLLCLDLLHLVHQLVDLIVDAWRQRLRKYKPILENNFHLDLTSQTLSSHSFLNLMCPSVYRFCSTLLYCLIVSAHCICLMQDCIVSFPSVESDKSIIIFKTKATETIFVKAALISK